MVGILLSYWDGLFSGAMLVSGRVMVSVKTMDIILHKSKEIWQDVLAVCHFRCAGPRECNYWEVGLLSGNFIQSRLGKTWGCLCEPAKLCGRLEYVDKHTPYSKEIGERGVICFAKMIIWKFDPWKSQHMSGIWWASEICTRLRPDKDQLFAIMFADLFLIEPRKKKRD